MTPVPPEIHVEVVDVTVITPMGPFARGTTVTVSLDAGGMVFHGGDPLAAWTVPSSLIGAPRLAERSDAWVLTAWISGRHVEMTFLAANIRQGSLDQIRSVLDIAEARPGRTPTSARSSVRRPVIVTIVVVLAMAAAISGVLGAGHSSGQGTTSVATARAQAASVSLRASDLPASWSPDSVTTSPLSGLLGTAPSTKPTAQDRLINNRIISDYQRCMGITNRHDRFFGAAGVQPIVQIPSLPYGIETSSTIFEAGTATQRYASSGDVAEDQGQASLPSFDRCFGAAMGRFVLASAGSSALTSTPEVDVQKLSRPLGVFVTGSTAIVAFPDQATSTSTTPIEIGTTLLIAGHFEQYLYTFGSPGAFSVSLRQDLVDILGARLSGLRDAHSA